MSIGFRIREQRQIANLTQPQLALLLGLSIDMIKSLETNRKKPSLETLEKMCDLFKCSADYLLEKDPLVSQLIVEFLKLDLENQQRVMNVIAKLNEE